MSLYYFIVWPMIIIIFVFYNAYINLIHSVHKAFMFNISESATLSL